MYILPTIVLVMLAVFYGQHSVELEHTNISAITDKKQSIKMEQKAIGISNSNAEQHQSRQENKQPNYSISMSEIILPESKLSSIDIE